MPLNIFRNDSRIYRVATNNYRQCFNSKELPHPRPLPSAVLTAFGPKPGSFGDKLNLHPLEIPFLKRKSAKRLSMKDDSIAFCFRQLKVDELQHKNKHFLKYIKCYDSEVSYESCMLRLSNGDIDFKKKVIKNFKTCQKNYKKIQNTLSAEKLPIRTKRILRVSSKKKALKRRFHRAPLINNFLSTIKIRTRTTETMRCFEAGTSLGNCLRTIKYH